MRAVSFLSAIPRSLGTALVRSTFVLAMLPLVACEEQADALGPTRDDVDAAYDFAPVPLYSIRSIGTLPGDQSSEANSINNTGAMVGTSWSYDGIGEAIMRPFKYQQGVMTELPTYLNDEEAEAFDINSSGQVVGTSWYHGPGFVEMHRAVLWENGQVQDLGGMGGEWTEATAINDAGVVVGGTQSVNGESHPFIWSAEKGMQVLTSIVGSAIDINEYGIIVGTGEFNGVWRAFVWDPWFDDIGYLLDLGPLGSQSWASGINDQGVVVGGYRNFIGDEHAFQWTWSTGLVDLGVWSATDVNNAGRIVGHTWDPMTFQSSGRFKYGAKYGTLPALAPGEDGNPRSVNACGRIAGRASTGENGKNPRVVAVYWSKAKCDP